VTSYSNRHRQPLALDPDHVESPPMPSAQASLFTLIAETGGPALADQLRFILEVDKLKSIVRQSPLMTRDRNETDAEHTWHIAMMAVVLADFAGPQVDVMRAVRMLLVHDIVEIDAGDTFLYAAPEVHAAQEIAERAAADRIFGLLPGPQGGELRALWDEFEAHESPDAHFARTMDRLQPFLLNVFTDGMGWRRHGVRASQVRTRMRVIADGSPALHALVERLIDESEARGYLAPG
ncbi:MAG: HD domain-containing protein, partial [Bauldia litoralis]